MDVYEFAMKMEMDGKAYYEKLAAETAIEGLQTIFTNLAADEQKHYETVLAIKSNLPLNMADTTVLETSKNLFQDLMLDQNILGSMKIALDGYQHAMKIEADSVALYEDMAKKEDKAETVQILLAIANEEKKHFNIMENLYDYTLMPKYYLEWREFGNLGRL